MTWTGVSIPLDPALFLPPMKSGGPPRNTAGKAVFHLIRRSIVPGKRRCFKKGILHIYPYLECSLRSKAPLQIRLNQSALSSSTLGTAKFRATRTFNNLRTEWKNSFLIIVEFFAKTGPRALISACELPRANLF